MEDNFIMSTSVMQYLEDIHEYMKEKHPLITENNNDINSDDRNDNDEEDKGGDPDSVEQAGSSEVNLNDLEHQDQLSLFNSKLSIRDESDEDLDMPPESSLTEMDIQKDDDTIKTTKTKSDSSVKESKPDDEEEPKFKKPKMTNKERARNARQRKKQYYEDLEKRAEYLEKKVVQLNSELDYCKRKLKSKNLFLFLKLAKILFKL